MTQRGMIMAKKPARWRIKTTPSIMGSWTASAVLKTMENDMAAMDKRVPCQACHT